MRAALAGPRDHRHRPAHALAEEIERQPGIKPTQQLDRGRGIGGQRRASRPQSAFGRRAKTALVVGIGGDAVTGPDLARPIKGMAVVVDAVKRQDHRLGFALGKPPVQGQCLAVGGDEARAGKAGHRIRLRRSAHGADSGESGILVGRRRAAEQHQKDGNRQGAAEARDVQPPAPAHADRGPATGAPVSAKPDAGASMGLPGKVRQVVDCVASIGIIEPVKSSTGRRDAPGC